jgi:hypothetical protein
MKKIVFLLFLLQIFVTLNANCRDSMERVSVCDLVYMPKLYEGKLVEVSATYLVSEESSEMYCVGCTDLGKIWVEFENESASKKVENEDIIPTFNVIFIGRFYASEKQYGHRGRYRFKFVAESTKKAKLIATYKSGPDKYYKKVQKKECVCKKEKFADTHSLTTGDGPR